MSDFDNGTETESTPSIPESGIGVTPPMPEILDDKLFGDDDSYSEEESESHQEEPEPEENTENEDLVINIDMPTLKQATDDRRPIFVPLPKDSRFSPGLALLPTTFAEYSRILENTDLKSIQEKDLRWLQTMTFAENNSYRQDTMLSASVRKGSLWSNLVERNELKVPLGMRRDKFKSISTTDGEISGSEAVDQFMAGTNLGRSVTIPLWNTGFWIKMQAPSAAYLAEIDRAIAFSKEELGLDAFGAIGTNDRLIFDEILLDAALKLVTRSSLPVSKSPLELKEYISSFDIDTIIWAMAVAAYPDGCDIAIPCTNCRHISQIKANLMRMNFVDESRLTKRQLAIMSGGLNQKVTIETLIEYQKEFEVVSSGSFTYNHSQFRFKIPTVAEYLVSGRQYIAGVTRAIYEVLKEDYSDDTKRAQALGSMLTAEDCCRYIHHIERVIINQPGSDDQDNQNAFVKDEDTIVQILRGMSGDATAVDNFSAAVNKFISEATSVIIGFPNVECPSCHKLHLTPSGEGQIVIPFNPAVGFFTLAQRKISQAGGQTLTELSTLGVNALLQKVSENVVPE